MTVRLIFLSLLLLAGCASQTPAPVSDGSAPPAVEVRPGHYAVKRGDTLYRIALEHGQDYKDLVAWNKLDNPNKIEAGQQLRVVPPEGTPVAVTKPVAASAPVEVKPVGASPAPTSSGGELLKRDPKGGKLAYSEENLAKLRAAESSPTTTTSTTPVVPPEKAVDKTAANGAEDGIDWGWPAAGKVMAGFSESGTQANKGLDIAAKAGDPVMAAASGVVSYAGTGLRGYGNLVVLRHSTTFLSVYAHNSKVLVKEKQTVTKGQKIAEAGSSDTDQVKLHFEIRRQGKPVDPAKYLPPQ